MGKRILCLLMILLLIPVQAFAAFSAQQAAELNMTLEADFDRYSTLGACVILFENGEITYTYCYGVQRPGGEKITPHCAFRVGSISKLISCIGFMRLVEDGKVSLDDPLSSVLGFDVSSPYYPDYPVTVRQLLTHTAALDDSPPFYIRATRGNVTDLSRLFSPSHASSTFLPGIRPGFQSEYSNFGGGILGTLIELLSGQELDHYMKENVFAPLHVDGAFQSGLLDVPLCDIYQMPSGNPGRLLSEDGPPSAAYAPMLHYNRTAGSLTITPVGLAKLMIMLCEGGVYGDVRILKNSTVAEMCTLQNFRGSVQCESGRGLFMNILTDYQVEGRTLYGHGGKAYGMLCAAYFDPTDRTGIVMVTNGCDVSQMYHGVGMLGRVVMTHVYDALDASGYEPLDPFLVID